MNQEAYLKAFGENCLLSVKITTAKNADYADPEDAFQNFENAAALVGISVERGILVRMADKMQRLSNLLQDNRAAQVKDESIDDTLVDLMTYANIMLIYRSQFIDKDSPEIENVVKQTTPYRAGIQGQVWTQEEYEKAVAEKEAYQQANIEAARRQQAAADRSQGWLSKLGWDNK